VAAATSSASPSLASLPLINNYLAFDLDELASTQALKYLGSPDKNLVASLAFKLSSEGQHYPALRLARDAINRGLGAQYPELYGLVYPRAWADIIAEGAAIPGIPEALAYAIIRSESVFDPTSVSYAGAVGLTQLMPSTASETAKGLKMKSYSLTDPRDNVRIGMTYYSYMLNRFGRKPIRAMFAYNAGPGRMQTWAKESGELPDDVLLETLNIAQPRQYAKNIIQAALAYGKVQFAIQAQDLLEYLVNATPLPAKPLPAAPLPAPSVPAAPELPSASTSQTAASTAPATITSAEAATGPSPQPASTATPNPQPSTDTATQTQPGTAAAGIGVKM
jgi:soluble lytic murein transglycosylase